ncbi:hypothetical protein KA082_02045 [Candidatus Woesebacteria bacterium]|nr:hypothetical protein [Candidatus Woesebacteria bacterium]
MPQLNASSRIMFEEAVKMGITCHVFADHETILMECQGARWYIRGSRTSLQSSVGKTIADLKPLTKEVLGHFTIPTAKARLVQKPEQLETLNQLQFPLVSKPTNARHGAGVTVGLKDMAEATTAFEKLAQPVLFEEMLEGIEYRVVCVDYKFVAAAFRKPAHVVGDSIHTITELIAEKNQHPWRGDGHENNLTKIVIDDTVQVNLKALQLTEASIPESGREVVLRKTANLSTGGEAWDVTDTVCDENKQLFETIARACDLNVVGIDIMCQSLETPIMTQEKAGVIEVNASPGLRMHHFPLQGKPRNVAKVILEMVLARLL